MDELDVTTGVVSSCGKFLSAIRGAIGKCYEPRYVRKMAEARACEIETISEAMRKNADVAMTYDNGPLKLSTEDRERLEMQQRTHERVALQEATRQKNIENVADKAYDQLEAEGTVTSDPIDPDWIRRFFNIVGDVSNNELQNIWARILSGEIKQPGSFSMRTLDTVRNISPKEAEIFQRVMPLVLQSGQNYFISSRTELLSKYGISYGDILCLDECGLIIQQKDLGITYHIEKGKPLSLLAGQYLIRVEAVIEALQEVRLEVYSLTCAGRELYDILYHATPLAYVVDMGKEAFKEGKNGVNVGIHEIIRKEGERVEFCAECSKSFCVDTKL